MKYLLMVLIGLSSLSAGAHDANGKTVMSAYCQKIDKWDRTYTILYIHIIRVDSDGNISEEGPKEVGRYNSEKCEVLAKAINGN